MGTEVQAGAQLLATPLQFVTDEQLAYVVDGATLPALLPCLAELTGDWQLVDGALSPMTSAISATPRAQGGMTADAISRAKALALQALQRLRAGSVTPLDTRSDAVMTPLVHFMSGGDDKYLPLAKHELGLVDAAGSWKVQDLDGWQGSAPTAVVIGCGPQGIQAARALLAAGLQVTVLEKNSDIGGTWYQNSYPGCRLDTPNLTFSYSFFQSPKWKHAYTERKELLRYFKDAAHRYGVDKVTRLGCNVTKLQYDDVACKWTVYYDDSAGSHREVANFVVSAVGQLNQPKIPDLPGLDSFSGPVMHTATWNHDVDLAGKKVGVIGTGASAFQVIPSIAGIVDTLTVFQRTPPWMYPAPDYHDEISTPTRWLLDQLPTFHKWMRFFQFYGNLEGRIPFVERDPEWSHPVSSSAKNEELRFELQSYLEGQFSDRPDLLELVIPKYPPGAKRMLRDNGVWAETLKRGNVRLVTAGIEGIDSSSVRDVDGATYECDILILGTGFHASEFLWPIDVSGLGGVSLRGDSASDVKAFFGVSVPKFPNLFLLYGPNTNLVVNGSLVFLQEMSAEFMMEQIRHVLESGGRSIVVREDACESYNAWVDEGNSRMSWSTNLAPSWYRNSVTGRSSQNWPFSMLDYWEGTHNVDYSASFDVD